jgi:hypothetical protein
MTDDQKEIESLKYRVSQLEMHMANLQRKDFEQKEEMKDQVKRSQNNLDQVEKMAGG